MKKNPFLNLSQLNILFASLERYDVTVDILEIDSVKSINASVHGCSFATDSRGKTLLWTAKIVEGKKRIAAVNKETGWYAELVFSDDGKQFVIKYTPNIEEKFNKRLNKVLAKKISEYKEGNYGLLKR